MTCPQCGGSLTLVRAIEDGGTISEPVMKADRTIGRRSRPCNFYACTSCEYAAEAPHITVAVVQQNRQVH